MIFVMGHRDLDAARVLQKICCGGRSRHFVSEILSACENDSSVAANARFRPEKPDLALRVTDSTIISTGYPERIARCQITFTPASSGAGPSDSRRLHGDEYAR